MKIQSQRINPADLRPRDYTEMFDLFACHFDRVDRARFDHDLSRKHWVIQLREVASNRLLGFSTQVLLNVAVGNTTLHALYSGDTIVDPAGWSETALMREWGRLVVELVEQTPPAPLYWFLISKGYRTYRFLPVFFREFFPRFDCPTPAWAQHAIDTLGESLFASRYDSASGLVMASADKERLRPSLAGVTDRRQQDPHVRYFLQRNPDFASGDELCCVAQLDVHNFTSAGIRLLDPENRPRNRLRTGA